MSSYHDAVRGKVAILLMLPCWQNISYAQIYTRYCQCSHFEQGAASWRTCTDDDKQQAMMNVKRHAMQGSLVVFMWKSGSNKVA